MILLSLAAATVFAAAAVTDIRARRISNALVLALTLVGVLRMAIEGGPVLADLGIALAIFAAGIWAFHFGAFGGGDVKLLAAGALWTGVAGVTTFLTVTALAGGALALGFLLTGQRRASLPYGVAIAVGGMVVTVGGIGRLV